jgi:choline monooxygenase
MAATLPYRWYVAPEIQEHERERVFRPSWQYAGHLGQLDGPDSFFPAHAAGVPVVVTRAGDGELRAFYNVCRHRGAVLVDTPGRRGTLQCPYHAWTYGLDGQLRGAPRSDREPWFERERLALVPVAVDTWGPFVFVSRDPEEPLADTLGDLPAVVAEQGLDLARLRFHHRTAYEVRANWKIALENYLECYHCALNHPGLMHVIDERAQRLEAVGRRLSQLAPPNAGDGAPYDLRGEVPGGQYHLLLPSLKLNVSPGRSNLSIGPVWPVAPDRTGAFLDYYFDVDADDAWITDFLAFDDQVGREDVALVEAVQRGAGSGALEQGRLLDASEALIVSFHEHLRAAL